jgi:DNA-binding IscR family transcriptional regulator
VSATSRSEDATRSAHSSSALARATRLARPPGEISLLDIVEAAEGPATFDHCVLRDGPCDWAQTCPVHDTWAHTQAALTRELASTSLAQMAAVDAAIEAGSYQPEAPPHTRLTDRHGTRN